MIRFRFSFHKKTSVDSITAGFHDTLKDLEAYAASQVEQSRRKHEDAVALLEASGQHEDEYQKAQNVAAKIGALLS